jgi:hypothetical protein
MVAGVYLSKIFSGKNKSKDGASLFIMKSHFIPGELRRAERMNILHNKNGEARLLGKRYKWTLPMTTG